MEKNTKNTIKENIGIKITKETNIFFQKIFLHQFS